eukprot:364514-Chlamydomonas_euryale.AAC.7
MGTGTSATEMRTSRIAALDNLGPRFSHGGARGRFRTIQGGRPASLNYLEAQPRGAALLNNYNPHRTERSDKDTPSRRLYSAPTEPGWLLDPAAASAQAT